ncbi:MAG: protein kinase [Calditrichia bacterium]
MIGKTISHYKIIDRLGEGGMGVVYKALDTSLNRKVALKFLHPHLTKDESTRKRFMIEAQAASALDHPNICTIHEVNETPNEELYICMAYYEGESLRQKIKKGPIPFDDALNIIFQIAQGLKAAHDEKIIHRDIKPGNILITERGEAKIVDFGLAKLAEISLTKSASSMGTAAYMCPEQIRGKVVDHRCDIWALGVVFYEMLTGHLPFKEEYPEPMMYAIVNEKPTSLSQYLKNVPELLQAVIDNLLNKDRVRRYQNIKEFLDDLIKLEPELKSNDKNSYPKMIYKRSKGILNRKIVIIVGIMLVLSAGFLLLENSIYNSNKFRPRHLVVISFENQTGEKQYDYLQKAIPNLLITSLEQNDNLSVATWERLNDLLKQKGMDNVDVINPELGFDICESDGIETIILGSYTKAGEVFALDVKMLDVESKELLQSSRTNGYGISSILTSQIDDLSLNILKKLGISNEMGKSIRPLSEVTTNSMEAYNYFIRGRDEWEKRNIVNSRRFFERAVKFDTTFATAYSYLAKAYYTLSNPKAGKEALLKAKNYSDKATEKEKLYIEVTSAIFLENNSEKRFDLEHKIIEKYPQEKRAHLDLAYYCYARRKLYAQALDSYKKVLELDPNFGLAYNQLALTYMEMGNYEKAIKTFECYASLNPGDANVFDSMGELYIRMGDFDRALAKYKEATEVESQYVAAFKTIAYIYALKEDYNQTMAWIDQYIKIAPSEGIKARGHLYKGFYCFWLGRFEQSQRELKIAADYYAVVEEQDGLADLNWSKGWYSFYLGDMSNGRKYFKEWFNFREKNYPQFTIRHKTEFYFFIGLINLHTGKIDSAKVRREEMRKLLSRVDLENLDRLRFYYDIFNLEFLLSQDSAQKAISISEKLSALQIPPIGLTSLIHYNLPFSNLRDFSARANLRMGNINEAITVYEKLIAFNPRRSKDRRLIHPTYYFRLAKLYEQKGVVDKAIEYYRKFLEIWKKADEGLPEIVEANKSLYNFKTKNN